MRSDRALFWLQLAVGAAGIAAAALSATTAALLIDPSLPAPAALRALCERMVPGVGPLLVLALAGIGLAVPLRGIGSVLRQVRAAGRLRRALPVEETRPGRPPVVVVQHRRPLAFCCGSLRPRIFVSTGARLLLDDAELEAVLAHERHHARRRDPLRLLLAQALRDAVFFSPVLTRCRARLGTLAELAADRSAIASVGVRPLAGALVAFDTHGGSVAAVSNERVDQLQGVDAESGIGLAALLGGLLTAMAVTTLALVTAAVAQQVSVVGLASTACAVLVIALPVFAGGLALGLLRSRRVEP